MGYWSDELHPPADSELSPTEFWLLKRRRARAVADLMAEREAESRRNLGVDRDLVSFAPKPDPGDEPPISAEERERLLGVTHLGKTALRLGKNSVANEEVSPNSGLTRAELDAILLLSPEGGDAVRARKARERAAAMAR